MHKERMKTTVSTNVLKAFKLKTSLLKNNNAQRENEDYGSWSDILLEW